MEISVGPTAPRGYQLSTAIPTIREVSSARISVDRTAGSLGGGTHCSAQVSRKYAVSTCSAVPDSTLARASRSDCAKALRRDCHMSCKDGRSAGGAALVHAVTSATIAATSPNRAAERVITFRQGLITGTSRRRRRSWRADHRILAADDNNWRRPPFQYRERDTQSHNLLKSMSKSEIPAGPMELMSLPSSRTPIPRPASRTPATSMSEPRPLSTSCGSGGKSATTNGQARACAFWS